MVNIRYSTSRKVKKLNFNKNHYFLKIIFTKNATCGRLPCR